MSTSTFQTQPQPPEFGRLKPYTSTNCPWCGNPRTTMQSRSHSNTWLYATKCTNCGATGPECTQPSDASRSWEWRMI